MKEVKGIFNKCQEIGIKEKKRRNKFYSEGLEKG